MLPVALMGSPDEDLAGTRVIFELSVRLCGIPERKGPGDVGTNPAAPQRREQRLGPPQKLVARCHEVEEHQSRDRARTVDDG